MHVHINTKKFMGARIPHIYDTNGQNNQIGPMVICQHNQNGLKLAKNDYNSKDGENIWQLSLCQEKKNF